MKTMFIRIYYDKYYFEYNISDVRTYLSIINKDLFIYYDNKIISNFIKEILVLNTIYFNSEYKFYFMIGIYTKNFFINQNFIKIKDIIDLDKNITIDLHNNLIMFDDSIYISYKLYEKGQFYFSNNIVLCIDAYEFLIIDNMLCVRQQIKYKMGKYFLNSVEHTNNYLPVKNYKYDFEFLMNNEVFKESVVKYITSPLIMISVMVIVVIFTKRYSMIIFMLASTLSTVIGSLFMYVRQNNKVKYHNVYVESLFYKQLNDFKKNVYNDLKHNCKTTDFKLSYDSQICLGYVLKQVDIDYNITSKSYSIEFLSQIKDLKYYCKLTLDYISVVGKYSLIYLYNLLIELHDKKFIFIGDFTYYEFLSEANYYKEIDQLHNINNCIIICNLNIDLERFKNSNTIIYINIIKSSDVIYLDSLYINKFNNEDLYVKLESSSKKLYLKTRKVIFDKSLSYYMNGIKLSSNYIIDIEKHGLIIGMTGSGKSVLLLQLILQICKNYSPNEAVIGIIDFKGSALISKVEKLPHISSLFSNLYGGYENVIASIKYELEYRQELFNNHNISEYNEIDFSLPRLFIFIDEFAELRKNVSEIINEIESIARIGRSLGVFLIISLQKSSGVITEQLRSNIGYNICLRVNSKQDSIEMVGVDTCANFTVPGEAIVNVDGCRNYIKIYNCLDIKKDNIIVNGVNTNKVSYLDDETIKLNQQYQKTKYVIWKSFPIHSKSGILINSPNCKEFINYNINYDHYLIVGNTSSGKSELIKTLLVNYNGCILYLGKDKSFINIVDIYIDSCEHLKVYLSYLKIINVNTYFIIDGYELFDNDMLFEFIDECLVDKHNIKIIVSLTSVVSKFNKFIKYFNHKFMFSVNDPNECYNIFYTKIRANNFAPGEGICSYNNKVLEFKNYFSDIAKSSKKYNIFYKDIIVYLSTFKEVDYHNCMLIYEYETFINKYFSNNIFYKHYRHFNGNLIVATTKFEYNYRRVNLISSMLYDVVEDDDVIIFCNLNCK